MTNPFKKRCKMQSPKSMIAADMRLMNQKGVKKLKMVLPFSFLFRSRSAGRVFEGTLAHFGTLLAPCGSFLVPFSGQFSINIT